MFEDMKCWMELPKVLKSLDMISLDSLNDHQFKGNQYMIHKDLKDNMDAKKKIFDRLSCISMTFINTVSDVDLFIIVYILNEKFFS